MKLSGKNPSEAENQQVPCKRPSSKAGFSLVELMIVVGIIGILAAMAVPKFKQFQAKARAAEAGNLLNHMHTLQETYHLEMDTYLSTTSALGYSNCTPISELGFEIKPCDSASHIPRYSYAVTAAVNTFTATADSGTGDANYVCPGKGVHSWSIDQDRTMTFKLGTTVKRSFQCE